MIYEFFIKDYEEHRICRIRPVKNLRKSDDFKLDLSFNKILDDDGNIIFGTDKLGRFGIGNRRSKKFLFTTSRSEKEYAYSFIAYVPDNFIPKKYINKKVI